MSNPSKQQIAAWKEQFGAVYELQSEGLKCWIKDPLSSLKIIQKAIQAEWEGGEIQYAVSILNDCWLDGNDEFKTVEKYANGLVDEISLIGKLPDYSIEERKDTEPYYLVNVENESMKCKLAKRHELVESETKNSQGKPFQTAVFILDAISLEPKKLKQIKENNRVYMGFLRATNALKDKAVVAVKKL